MLTASTPVAIKGTFRDPQIDVVSEELEQKGLAALALGVVLPVIGAILPFIETGEAEGVNCAALMKAAGGDAARHSERQARQFERALSTLRFMVAPCLESLTTRSAGAGARRRAHAGPPTSSRIPPRGRLFSLLSAVAVLDLYGDIGTSPLYGGDTFPAVGAAHTQWVVVGYLSRVSGTWNPITP